MERSNAPEERRSRMLSRSYNDRTGHRWFCPARRTPAANAIRSAQNRTCIEGSGIWRGRSLAVVGFAASLVQLPSHWSGQGLVLHRKGRKDERETGYPGSPELEGSEIRQIDQCRRRADTLYKLAPFPPVGLG